MWLLFNQYFTLTLSILRSVAHHGIETEVELETDLLFCWWVVENYGELDKSNKLALAARNNKGLLCRRVALFRSPLLHTAAAVGTKSLLQGKFEGTFPRQSPNAFPWNRILTLLHNELFAWCIYYFVDLDMIWLDGWRGSRLNFPSRLKTVRRS